ncbi:CPBP family intramembrane glutamic endopeptidase [Marinifilum caeruleilacunae]|uniref:CPBP family intramembrane metalloprotease n=1 Tax=Marinifilum caeruleilacunae TaxID=2499076 RepID=A0ABX1X1Z5_9BACT|nr:CPBP family intramembrane glutamic endopeptidase [Marinifilum caeruleilacunae]NOU62104.1 CPBP family intramembrane metalloprotease [Marinifilum caeruleilacunae]
MDQINSNPAIKHGWLRAILIIIPFFIVSGIFQAIGLILYGAITGTLDLQNLQNVNMSTGFRLTTQFTGMLGTLLIVWIFARFIDKRKFVDLGFSLKNRGKDIFYGLIAGIVMMGLGTIILQVNGNLTIDSIHFAATSLLQSVFLFIIVSVNEEVLVRGYILPNFMDSMNRYLALVLSSLIFTALHLFNPNVSFLGITNIFLAGILLGIGYIFTKNLWFPLALHFSWNFFQGPIFGFEVSGTDTDTLISQSITGNELLTGGKFGFEGSLLASLLCTAAIILFWYVYKKQDFRLQNA